MRTSVVGNKRSRRGHGFTLIELMVVLALVAIAAGGAMLAMRDAPEAALQREADRLVALLEAARAQSRASGLAIVWQADEGGFAFVRGPASTAVQGAAAAVAEGSGQGMAAQEGARTQPPDQSLAWLDPQVRALPAEPLLLGPEPIIEARSIVLALQGRSISVFSDGLRPFAIARLQAEGATP